MIERRWEMKMNSSSLDVSSPNFQIPSIEDSSKAPLNTKQSKNANADLKFKKAWEVAKSPSKSIFMSLFMAWMSGNSVNIFSIMITLYSFINPVKAILSLNSVFNRFEDPANSLLLAKLLYVAINMVTVIIAVYKFTVLGLLPTTASDWSSYLPIKDPLEFSTGFIG
eukprot:TRINITY_DN2136_c0_g1_i1.p1 TRINITY_DN2136_c0_g1~~TRINITY_DN2136_c0_g1_i1.p1  ORF type:complete len:167 (-),score=59.03 TRINITY_DN2136_c0_g1_i1:38-538(-)